MRSPRAIAWRISADGLRRPRSIWLRYGFEMPAQLAQLAQRQPGVAALVADELAEIVEPRSRASRTTRASSRGPGNLPGGDLALERVDHAVQLARAGRRAHARTRAASASVDASSSAESAGRFASVVSATSCSRPSGQWRSISRRVGRRHASVGDRRAAGLRAQDAGQVRDEIVDRAAAARGARTRPRGSRCAPARDGGGTTARSRSRCTRSS